MNVKNELPRVNVKQTIDKAKNPQERTFVREDAVRELATVAKKADAFESASAVDALRNIAERLGDGQESVGMVMMAAGAFAAVQTAQSDKQLETFLGQKLVRPNSQWAVLNGLAERKDANAVRLIAQTTAHPFQAVRQHALSHLSDLAAQGVAGAREPFQKILKTGADGDRLQALGLAAKWKRPDVGLLLEGLAGKSASVQREAVNLLKPHLSDSRVRPALTALAQSTASAELKQAIAAALQGR